MNDIRIIKSSLFEKYPEIIFGFSTKVGLSRECPFYFNMSFTVGDIKEKVIENRSIFFTELGLSLDRVAYQLQFHSDVITDVTISGSVGKSDALITTLSDLGLAVSSADCAAIFIYDPTKKVIAAVHSGWRGTEKRILEKTLVRLKEKHNSFPGDLVAYIGPSISQKNYEVGEEVASKFDKKYISLINGKVCLDVAANNYDMLLDFGIPSKNIEMSPLCSFEEKYLHSFRRDGNDSGRALGVIALRK